MSGEIPAALRVVILLFTSRSTLVVEPGNATHSLVLPPVFRFVVQHGLVAEDVSPALRLSVANRDVLSSYPLNCPPAYKEEMLQFLLHLGASSVGLVSDCVLASFAYGVTSAPCIVISIGMTSIVCAGVERGSVEYFLASSTHGMQSLIDEALGNEASERLLQTLDVESDAKLYMKLFGRGKATTSDDAPSLSVFHSLLRRMPKSFLGSPILICGEGTALGGFVAAFCQHAKKLGFPDVRSLPEPWNAVLYGASLLGTLADAELRRLVVTRADVVAHGGPSVVHMRSP
jgi:hypothetical protein